MATEGGRRWLTLVIVIDVLVVFVGLGVSVYAVAQVPRESLASAAFSFAFFLANVFFGFFSLNYAMNYWHSRLSYRAPPTSGLTGPGSASVALLVPIYNEPFAMVENNLEAARIAAGNDGRLYVLDDSTSEDGPRIRALAESMGALYRHRERRRGYKAGAINDALEEISEEYVAVLDIDQMPSPGFLRRVVPILDTDPRVGFVQLPQEYANTDASLLARLTAAQQFIFYQILTEGKSVEGTLFSCGTNVVYRRSALASVGNFDESSIVEDIATSTRMAAAGWKGVYLNEPLVYGRAPVTMEGYINQQWRWARGTVGLLPRVVRNLVLSGTLGWRARFDWLATVGWYLYGWFYLPFLLAPILMILGVQVLLIPEWLYFVAWLPYGVVVLGLFAMTQIRRGGSPSTVYLNLAANLIMFPVSISATLSALARRRRPFTTARTGGRLPWYRFWPQFAVMASIAVALPFLLLQGGWFGYVTAFWAIFQLTLFLPIFWLNQRPRPALIDAPAGRLAA